MADRAAQRAFRFRPLAAELNIARTGLSLDWRRIARRSRRMLVEQIQASGVVTFALGRQCDDRSLCAELRHESRRKARALRRDARARGSRLPGRVILALMPEGRRIETALDWLDRRIVTGEATVLCG